MATPRRRAAPSQHRDRRLACHNSAASGLVWPCSACQSGLGHVRTRAKPLYSQELCDIENQFKNTPGRSRNIVDFGRFRSLNEPDRPPTPSERVGGFAPRLFGRVWKPIGPVYKIDFDEFRLRPTTLYIYSPDITSTRNTKQNYRFLGFINFRPVCSQHGP